MNIRTCHKLPLWLCALPVGRHSGGAEEFCRGRGLEPSLHPPPRQSSVRSGIFIARMHRGVQAPSGAACTRSAPCRPDMPLQRLRDLRARVRIGEALGVRGIPALFGWPSLPPVAPCPACAARPAMPISCNNSARLPLYPVDGRVRRMKRSTNAMIRTRSNRRPVALAALAGPSSRRLGAAPAGSRCQIAGPARVLSQIPKPRP
jgi:hypothetical protein